MKKIIILIITSGLFFASYAQEAKFQAMSVYDFTRMLQWPKEYRQGDFFIKVYGDTEIYDEIKTFTKDKQVRGEQKIVVQKINDVNIGKCHILVVAKADSAKFEELLKSTINKGTLVITQEQELIKLGAGISFIKNGKGRYYYSLKNIIAQKINISTSFKQIGEEIILNGGGG